ncbi:hypothetical protein [Variovorax arabinosiphilus]|uniref:hypothetical protein n=1 Tax=Variovorax arabinosiphilus TaxID=3053498 RepID=UPI002574B49A|nr:MULTISPECIES: hypothetical protein [unclassified Variovorax]MDM0118917.1 hypothetical protein [Variovorax sp. J2L1-78]MDM0129343.1 hypothetical protein [Variovorax sp. J2L1-63]MDM0232871.1 hypothetical protein [Variovorax sp. J2R1-6]
MQALEDLNEWLLGLLLTRPRLFIFCGRALFALASAMAVLGWRFDKLGHKVERLSARAGVAPPDFMAGLPWWLRLFVPETTSGWIGIALLALAGISMALAGKWARKIHQ